MRNLTVDKILKNRFYVVKIPRIRIGGKRYEFTGTGFICGFAILEHFL